MHSQLDSNGCIHKWVRLCLKGPKKSMQMYSNGAQTKPKLIYHWGWDAVTVGQILQQYICNHFHWFLDTEGYPVLQAVGAAKVAKLVGVVSYLETTEKSRWSIPHFVFNQGTRQAVWVTLETKLYKLAKQVWWYDVPFPSNCVKYNSKLIAA